MTSKNIPTYGEAYIHVLTSDWIVRENRTVAVRLPQHKPKMKKEEALKYYSAKLKKIWVEMLTKEYKDMETIEGIIKMVSTNSIKYRRYCKKLKKEKE